MAGTFTIFLDNESSMSRDYIFFNKTPDPSSPSVRAYSNVWITARDIESPHGLATLNVREQFYAVSGSGQRPINEGAILQVSSLQSVVLTAGSTGGSIVDATIAGDNSTVAATDETVSSQNVNSFGITVNPFQPGENPDVYVGIGKQDKEGNVIPIVTWYPMPTSNYIVQPEKVFYVTAATEPQGTCVDAGSYDQIGTIDFGQAQPGQTIANITHQPDNTWGPAVFS